MITTDKATISPNSSEIDHLRKAVETMDLLSQAGFSQIEAISKLALAYLETPDGYKHIEVIYDALKVIKEKAFDIQNCINCEAEEVGCNYIDEDKMLRRSAFTAYMKQK